MISSIFLKGCPYDATEPVKWVRVLTRHGLLCIVVDVTSVHVVNVFNFTVVDIMTVDIANLYIVLVRCSSYLAV
jgi:hypothetical protein